MLVDKLNLPKNGYDAIIVGGGLGGLTVANVLGSRGHKVLLLEAHHKLGGLATWFRRKGHIFDVSLHGFPYLMKKTCKRHWNKEIAETIFPLTKIRFINPQFDLTTDYTREDFTKIMTSFFKIEELKVKEFFEYIFSNNLASSDSTTTAKAMFERFFPGRKDVLRFLMEPITYANGHSLEDPQKSYAIVFGNFIKKGVYTVRGGTDHLISLMQQELLNNGVDIGLSSSVEKIIVDNGKVRGVRVNGQSVFAKAVISNGNIIKTIFSLVGKEHFRPTFIEESKKVRLNTSSCQVYMGIKDGEEISDIGDLIFHSKAPQFDYKSILDFNISSRTFSIYYPKIRPAVNRYTIVSSSNAKYDDWAKLSKSEYKKAKEMMIDETISVLETIIPNVSKKIDYLEAATPLTISRYTHHLQGASFGTRFEGLDISLNLSKEVHGLFHSGSVGIIMSGWPGTTNYGVVTANNVESFLYKESGVI